MTPTNRQIIESFWAAFDRFEFETVAPLLHDDFVFELPQSGERIRGRDNFIAMNRHYPGQWRIAIVKLVASGDEVVTEITATYGEQKLPAISFFTLRESKILHIREFWPEAFAPQEWRAHWVEKM
jgi:ketosteroid isomerase-like protein